MAIPKIEPHSRYEDLPMQMSESRNSLPVQQSYNTAENSTITDSVNKSVREDGVVSIREMLSNVQRTESAMDFIHRLEEEEQCSSPFKRTKKLKSPTKRLMRREHKKKKSVEKIEEEKESPIKPFKIESPIKQIAPGVMSAEKKKSSAKKKSA